MLKSLSKNKQKSTTRFSGWFKKKLKRWNEDFWFGSIYFASHMDKTQRFRSSFKPIQSQVCKISSITLILFLELRSTMVSTSMSTSVPTSVSTSASTTTFETSATIMTSIPTEFPSFNHNLMRSRKRSIRRVYKLIVVMAGFQLVSRGSTTLQSL